MPLKLGVVDQSPVPHGGTAADALRATLELADDLQAAGASVEIQPLDFDGHQYDLPTWCAVMKRTRGFMAIRGSGAE